MEADCFNVNPNILTKFNMYLFDGPHSKDDHCRSLTHFYNCLEDVFVFIVDDWNWENIRNGTRDAIKKLNLKILYDQEVRTSFDNSHPPAEIARQNWWNGLYIAVLQKP